MGRFVIATIKSWNIENARKLKAEHPEHDFYLITKKEDFTKSFLDEVKPQFVFLPHWSWLIPPEIFKSHNCVVFHMTDLPYGRGGSPLQNLIVRGIYRTKLSAITVEEDLDSGAVYFKEPLDISYGNADEILTRSSEIIFKKMLPQFLNNIPVAKKQEGEVVTFRRRTPKESEIPDGLSPRQLYDYIRMLDGEGYPTAYKDVGDMRIYFKNAKLLDETVSADTTIIRR